MDKSFASLLRNSRLASFDRSLPRVYTTPKSSKKVGDWGLKRTLPTVIRTRYATISDLDTAEHQTPWQSGEGQVLFVKRWKENFPNSKKPVPRPETIEHNVALMNPAEFKRFLKDAAKKAPEFKAKLEKKELVPDQLFEYLNVHFSDKPATPVVGPSYSEHEHGWGYPVLGRILNADKHGHAVGIGGVVALLSKHSAIGLRNTGDRRVRTFYVKDAEIDEEGRPVVTVDLHAPGSTVSSIMEDDFTNQSSAYAQSKFGSMSADEMFRLKPRRDAPIKEENENVEPNPRHQFLMARINGLLKSSDPKE
ncbi:hypothetical protein DFQ28_006959 [Apophysomyces sp. BC1034]|nr:hypothetical protein DFQ30_005331 [Apophysomyces sp. BC1015]KAG0172503.1 hypothetical protein DFQ29_008340 [Apophysomyces sp. BC1021]KAG0187040.1 hypothetical protein DFQ28_006959 [Apophysomyces sp. BC1034]